MEIDEISPSPLLDNDLNNLVTMTRSALDSTSSTRSHLKRGKDGGSRLRKSKNKALYFWTCEDVIKWLKKHCGQYYQLYGETFREHDINGRSLVRLNDCKLQKMNITDSIHREELMRHIMRLKLKTEASELKTLDQKTSGTTFNRK